MHPHVAVFTDTYLPTVNGVTYTIKSWRDRWRAREGRMDVVYPDADEHAPDEHEYPVRSVSFPFYEGFRLGTPRIPDAVADAEIVHAHTPFAIGLGGLRLARRADVPLVASYHTPTGEYASYLSSRDSVADRIERVSEAYERWFFGRADVVLAPSDATRRHLIESVGIDTPVEVLPNGVDVEQFRPTHPAAFRRKYDLVVDRDDRDDGNGRADGDDGRRPIVGYTGRHGYEKRLTDLIDAAAGMDVTVVLGGDGPAREDLEAQARETGADVRFLGFLDREELPAFYSALDVFAFPSPVETQGLVALEANACGTPAVGANSAALAHTIDDGETGYHFETGDIEGFRDAIRRALADRDRLHENCLERRNESSVDHAVDRLAEIYAELLDR